MFCTSRTRSTSVLMEYRRLLSSFPTWLNAYSMGPSIGLYGVRATTRWPPNVMVLKHCGWRWADKLSWINVRHGPLTGGNVLGSFNAIVSSKKALYRSRVVPATFEKVKWTTLVVSIAITNVHLSPWPYGPGSRTRQPLNALPLVRFALPSQIPHSSTSMSSCRGVPWIPRVWHCPISYASVDVLFSKSLRSCCWSSFFCQIKIFVTSPNHASFIHSWVWRVQHNESNDFFSVCFGEKEPMDWHEH